MAKTNATGRSKRENNGKFLLTPHSVFDSPGYAAAGVIGQAVYGHILRRYNGMNNGSIAAPCRAIADKLDIGHVTVSRAIITLVNCGLIRMTKAASFSGKRVAAEYRLTHVKCHKTHTPPTREYLHYGKPATARSSEDG